MDGVSFSSEQPRLSDLDYADDIVLLAESASQLQSLLNRLQARASRIGLEINEQKTKVMCCCAGPIDNQLNGSKLEQVEQFNYLGSMFWGLEMRLLRSPTVYSKLAKPLVVYPHVFGHVRR